MSTVDDKFESTNRSLKRSSGTHLLGMKEWAALEWLHFPWYRWHALSRQPACVSIWAVPLPLPLGWRLRLLLLPTLGATQLLC